MSLTNVPVDRQKFIIKGKSVKDEATYKSLLKNVSGSLSCRHPLSSQLRFGWGVARRAMWLC